MPGETLTYAVRKKTHRAVASTIMIGVTVTTPPIHLHAQELQPRKPPRNGSPRGLGEALEPFQFDIRHMATWVCVHTPIATLDMVPRPSDAVCD